MLEWCGSAGTSSHLILYIEIGPVHSHITLDSSLLAHLQDSGSLPALRSSQALWEIPDCSNGDTSPSSHHQLFLNFIKIEGMTLSNHVTDEGEVKMVKFMVMRLS